MVLQDCPGGSDNQFGPRVDIACRYFDFTLLFEDAFLVALPAALLLLVLPFRLKSLWSAPLTVGSYKLAISKLLLLSVLFISHLLFLVFRLRHSYLQTSVAIPSGVLAACATVAAGILSFLEDQRSVKPSDALVLYFSAASVTYIAVLRSLWLIPDQVAPRAAWTAAFIFTTLAVFLESARKPNLIRPFDRSGTREQVTGLWSRGFFTWVIPFLRRGNSEILVLRRVPRVDDDLQEEAAYKSLETAWNRRQTGRHRLLRAAFEANFTSFISAVPPRIALSAFGLCQPFLIEAAVSYLTVRAKQETPQYYGPALVGAFALVYLGNAISRALYGRQTNRLIARVRSGLIAKIYRHTTGLRSGDVKNSAAVTLMGTDVEVITDASRTIHELWASIPEMGIAVWLLARQMSWAAVAPLVICLVSVALTSWVAAYFGAAQRVWTERVQHRIAVTTGLLGNMKAVKMLGLTGVMGDVVTELRRVELETSKIFRKLAIWRIFLSNLPEMAAPFATFAVYAIIMAFTEGTTLTAAQAFASLSLIGLMTHPILMFCQALPSCVQSMACFSRIQEYCLLQASTPPPQSSSESLPLHEGGMALKTFSSGPVKSGTLISFSHASVSWSTTSEPVLLDLTLDIMPGLTAVVGKVASGKSTLLSALLGEAVLSSGSMHPTLSKAAFCSQTPWIMNDTIRQNVTGGGTFDEKWYEFSVVNCGLQQDLATMPRGDQTIAGSNGASLSGGQRQRVALARAVYSRLPVVILDDVMSGLDATTARLIASRLFGKDGHFRTSGISVILATHDENILPYMDTIIELEDGKVARSRKVDKTLHSEVRLDRDEQDSLEPLGGSPAQEITIDKASTTDISMAPILKDKQFVEEVREQDRQKGNWAVYGYYCRSAGAVALLLWGTCTLAAAGTGSGSTIWLQKWTEANAEHPNQSLGFYIGIYALFFVLNNLGVTGELWFFFINIVLNTATKLHSDLLAATLKATYSFFGATDVGSITNRFSQDMNLIDMALPNQAAGFTTGAASSIVQLVILCVLGKYLAAAIPVLGATLFVVQRYYLRTSRQVRLLDIEAKAPLYKHFIETVSGIATIRAFGWEHAFHNQHRDLLDISQAPFYMLLIIQQWLVLVLDLVVGALAVVIIAIAMFSNNSISAGSLGVSLALVLQFNSLLTMTIQFWTKLETSIGAVARVKDFVRVTPSEQERVSSAPLPSSWPASGDIQFQNVEATYGPSTEPVLSQLSISVRSGEKLAVVGPSGSGKSTMVMTMLKMIDLTRGSVSIDGVDIATLSPSDVRSRINVVPQEPFLMPGTSRFNLDPHGRCADDALKAATHKVSMWDKISARGGLDMILEPSEWSHGERQLLCLARALLVPSTILILDEATSSVDEQTEAIMQQVIETEFRGHTVIAVLHRLKYINRYDRVLVLKQGQTSECDAPGTLLGRDSALRTLYQAHGSQ